MPKPKANEHIKRITYLRCLCSSADKMHTETARLVTELATAPRVTKSAAIEIKRLAQPQRDRRASSLNAPFASLARRVDRTHRVSRSPFACVFIHPMTTPSTCLLCANVALLESAESKKAA